ncbi:glycosyltransferase [Yoonia sp. R2331]|uniref:glycosyltransferase n=1 Tax=Yoonia sp. R2331 TaxID=3237238 RepID=UPI0034E386FC
MSGTAILAGDLAALPVASTAFARLVALAESLPDAAVLHCPATPGPLPPAAQALRDADIKLAELPGPPVRTSGSPHGKAAAVALRTWESVKRQKFDTLHVIHDLSAAHFLLGARHLGLWVHPARIVAHVVDPVQRQFETGRATPANYAAFATCFMDRQCVARADAVVAHSKTVRDWLVARNWRTADQIALAPGLARMPGPARHAPDQPQPLARLIFAGTQTDTRGLTTCAYALRVLATRGVDIPQVVISGRTLDDFPAKPFLAELSEQTGIPIETLPLTRRAALLDLARQPGSLTLVVPQEDDAPAVLPELLATDAPVIATTAGDTPALVGGDTDILCPAADHIALADLIETRIAAGLVTAYQSHRADDLAQNARAWDALHTGLPNPTFSAAKDTESPLVSVCIAHHNRPQMIRDTLDAVVDQGYANLEILVVDDGSTADNRAALAHVLADYPAARMVPQDNRYLGAARNAAAKAAKGKYLLFKDDDNISMRHEIATFVRAAEHSDAEILTCFSDNFSGDSLPDEASIDGVRRVPFGQDVIYGMFRNGFGDSNCFVRRDVWERLGGFTEHFRVGLDDQEFFMRATLAGVRVDVLPEALYYYRLGGAKMKRFHVAKLANAQRLLTPVLASAQFDANLMPLFLLARSLQA